MSDGITEVKAMIVQEIAKQTGISPQVIRYYARIGLLEPRRNPRNGYRQFGEQDAQRLRFIRLAQELGYTLRDIKEMLVALDRGELSENWIRITLDKRLSSTRQKLQMLQRLERCIELTLKWHLTAPPPVTDLDSLISWMRSTMRAVNA
jgi:DNA-binding transcriptional MerR regulator